MSKGDSTEPIAAAKRRRCVSCGGTTMVPSAEWLGRPLLDRPQIRPHLKRAASRAVCKSCGMVLATDAHGNELLGVTQGTASDAPLTGALVVAIGPEGVLLVHDVWRDQWEVAGGGIEAGESAEEAAVREVAEESGQQLTAIKRVGRVTFRLVSDGRVRASRSVQG